MSIEMKTVIDFCLKHAEAAPVLERISLYRSLAEFCSDKEQAAQLRSIAADLLRAEHRCREFRFAVTNGGGK